MGLDADFPSLKLSYEQVKDTLSEQATIIGNYINRAITLFAVATAVIGIGLPLLFTKEEYQHYLTVNIPVISLSILPILLYIGVFIFFWVTIRPEFIKTVSNPKILLDEAYPELKPNEFYSEVIQDIALRFSENEELIRKKENGLKWLIGFMMAEVAMVVSLAVLFSFFWSG